MKRGELWTLRDEGYASKPRPVLVLQADEPSFESIVLCLVTSFDSQDMLTRIEILPHENNGLRKPSYIMADKIVTVNKALLGQRIGSLDADQMRNVIRAIALTLGIRKDDLF